MLRKMFVVLLALSGAACAAADNAPPQTEVAFGLVEDGRDIAMAQCARCHAVGAYGESPMQGAPLFREVLSLYPAGVLKQELIEGIRVAHPMPDFQFNPQGADALIAYLRSIQSQTPAIRPA